MQTKKNLEENNLIVKLVAKYDQRHILKSDLADSEGPIPNRAFTSFFNDAKAIHIPFTIHAGESSGPESMQEALDLGTKVFKNIDASLLKILLSRKKSFTSYI